MLLRLRRGRHTGDRRGSARATGGRRGRGTRFRRASWPGRARSLVSSRIAPSRRPACPNPRTDRATKATQLRVALRETARSAPEARDFARQVPLEDRDRAERQQPHHRADLQPLRLRRSAAGARRRRSRLPRPTCRRLLARVDHRGGNREEVLEELAGHAPRRPGRASASSMAISSMFWQKRAIQAVPSACSR